jgi:hypothetical protein
MAQLDSASDLAGHDAGGGDVALTWSYPVDIVAHSIVFDVFGSGDPLDVFHMRYAQSVAALSIPLSGFGFSGDRFFTVVARRGDELSLPSRLLRLARWRPAAVRAGTAARCSGGRGGTRGSASVRDHRARRRQGAGGDGFPARQAAARLLLVPGGG